jgi:hypothetical protein
MMILLVLLPNLCFAQITYFYDDLGRLIKTIETTTNVQPLILGQNTICQFDTLHLSVSIFSNYVWSTGDTTQNISIIPDQPGEFYALVDALSADGCLGKDTFNYQVLESPLLDLGPDTLMKTPSEIIILDAGSGNKSYLWSTGSMVQHISIINSGLFCVTVTNNINGCTSSDCIFIDILSNSIDQYHNQIKIYPNPVNSYIKIDTSFPLHDVEVLIVNVAGHIVKQTKVDNAGSIDVSNLESGFYFLSLNVKGQRILNKFVKI